MSTRKKDIRVGGAWLSTLYHMDRSAIADGNRADSGPVANDVRLAGRPVTSPVLDTDKLLAVWRIDAESRSLLRGHWPVIAQAFSAIRSDLYAQFLMDERMALLLPDEEARQRAVNGIMEHWEKCLSGKLDRAAILRMVSICQRYAGFDISPQTFMLVGQSVLAHAVKALVKSGLNADASAAINVVSRVVMMSLDVVSKVYSSAFEAASATETSAYLRELHSLKQAAYVDALTGLFNRRYFDKAMVVEISRAIRQEQPLCLIMIDIDLFKSINDRWGHTVGDMVLAWIARTLHGAGRPTDIVTRYGGEEFVIILPNTSPDSARIVAERLRASVAASPIKISEGVLVSATISLGVGTLGPDRTLSGVIESADAALYLAKLAGRNRVEVGSASHAGEFVRTDIHRHQGNMGPHER